MTHQSELAAKSTEDLRQLAFEKAQRDHDFGFFWDLVRHLPASRALAGEDGSGGGLTGSLTEVVALVRELLGKDLGAEEPLLRARYLDYLSPG